MGREPKLAVIGDNLAPCTELHPFPDNFLRFQSRQVNAQVSHSNPLRNRSCQGIGRGIESPSNPTVFWEFVVADKTQVCVFRFGPYESRAKSLELYKHGTKLKVCPQPLRLLNLLLSNAGEVLTRDELRQELWSSETFVDFEHGLNSAIKSIRSALNDSVSEPRYIETIPKVGYRFIAPVERTGEAAKSSGTPQSDVVIQEASSARQEGATSTAEEMNTRKRPWAAAFAVAAVIVLAAVGSIGAGMRRRCSLPHPRDV